jgi:uncharacterized delta-60 repeat protein
MRRHWLSRSGVGLFAAALALLAASHACARAGDVDGSFGVSGVARFSRPGALEPAGLAVTADNRPVAVATYRASGDNITRFLLARWTVNGQLDTTFGNGLGYVETPLGNVDGEPRAIAIDRQGRIVVAGYQFFFGKKVPLILRYLANGTLDSTFGTGGGAVFELDTAGQEAAALALDSEDRIVAITSGGTNYVFRLKSNGAADETFGLGGATTLSAGISTLALRSVTHDSEGRVVIAGDTFDLRTSAFPQFLAIRLTSRGAVDETFGTAGRATYAFSRRAEDRGTAVVAAPSGALVLAGFATDAALVRNPALVKLTTTGAADVNFGSAGSPGGAAGNVNSRDASPRGIVSDPLGRLYVFADGVDTNNQSQPVILRWTASGRTDEGFANAGLFQGGGRGEPGVARGLGLDRFGRPLLLSGRVLGEEMTVVRLRVDETVDFDQDGLPNELEIAEGTNPLVRDHAILGSDSASVRRFVAQLYRDYFGREGDVGGIAYWQSRIFNGMSRASVANAFFEQSRGAAAIVIRQYRGILGRDPDRDGLLYWSSQVRAGLTPVGFADAMVQAPEFAARNSSLSHAAFVEFMYASFLGRNADSVGGAYWAQQLSAGLITRAALVARFAESEESVRNSLPAVSTAQLYVASFARPADPAGASFWQSQLALNGSIRVLESFIASAEFRARFISQ